MKRAKTPTFLLELPLRVDCPPPERGSGSRHVLRGVGSQCETKTTLAAQDGAAAPRQQSRELRRARAHQKTRRHPPALAREHAVPGNQATACRHRAQTRRPSQESAWSPGTSHRADGHRYSNRKDLLQRMAEAVWSQRWHQCACGLGPVQRDLYSAFQAFPSGRRTDHPLCHPARLGKCGAAEAHRDRGPSTTCE